jgi:hypothetical protein
MKLYYKKYGLNMRGIAPFFDPDKFETYNYEGEIMRLLQKNVDAKPKRRMNQTSRTKFMQTQEIQPGLLEPL